VGDNEVIALREP